MMSTTSHVLMTAIYSGATTWTRKVRWLHKYKKLPPQCWKAMMQWCIIRCGRVKQEGTLMCCCVLLLGWHWHSIPVIYSPPQILPDSKWTARIPPGVLPNPSGVLASPSGVQASPTKSYRNPTKSKQNPTKSKWNPTSPSGIQPSPSGIQPSLSRFWSKSEWSLIITHTY
jgi:hypothetical protein